MAAGCAEAHEPEAGVWTPRSPEAFESTEGVKRGAERAEDWRPGSGPGPGETPSLYHPVLMIKTGFT